MEELINRITIETGLAPQKAERALGIMLELVRTQGNQAKVDELFAAIPGAAELARRHGGDGTGSTSLLGKLGGGLMGGPLAAVSRLSAAGLNMEEIRKVGTLMLDHAKARAGSQLVKEVAGSIPGLSGYV
jgi:hypothetical protein